ncbi:hypothetical protein BVU17_09455 [Haloarcula taiwanensis]|uniref:Uncharacterized protein n=1 Tax=Haloarcula taiwanensis TaxID=1932004 RepID=A0A2H5A2F5_9EURY|nr:MULTISPECIES: hypothetical protein [Haloarcula]AUG48885.1 hypothetical protein BVU17_09455 [Haloarcula taiwanensis]RLM39035.1 hypothetical protein DVK01_00310 [Haloarcula sp. Atlit-120R]RLM48348.1 hypothetical protein DVK00_00310 [Haloarcula sp. Atlit-47R]RLM90672.1 hypothetical protein D3D01_17275 [Haloarcula sp. Atlit-7R]
MLAGRWRVEAPNASTDSFFIGRTYYRPMPDRHGPTAALGVGGGLAACVAAGFGYAALTGPIGAVRTIHVWVGTAWTALVLAYGFVLAPLLRERDTAAAYPIVARLAPTTLVLLPTLTVVTLAAGVTMALAYGIVWPMTTLVRAVFGVAVAIAGIALLGVLPADVLTYRELRSADPDPERVVSLGVRTATLLTVQGALQVTMLFLMLRVAAMTG